MTQAFEDMRRKTGFGRMAVYNLYSKRRNAALKAGEPEVYSYDEVPAALRVQVVHIWLDALGRSSERDPVRSRWDFLGSTMAREKGLMQLIGHDTSQHQCIEWLRGKATHEDALDMIELSFRMLDRVMRKLSEHERHMEGVKVSAQEAIDELNRRFREHGLGYQFENGDIIRIDSQFVHADVVKPALVALAVKPFEKANEDFMTAHEHYRHGRHKDSVVAAQRASESTLKAICKLKGWKYGSGDRLSELITIVRNHGLFPAYLDRPFDSYIAMLKTGLPGVRNSAGGHGDSPAAPPVPDYIAAYALHMTATNIVMSMRAFSALE
jgi:hypothetical protein